MNIKINVNAVKPLLGTTSIEQIYNKLKAQTSGSGIEFCRPTIGAGYLQWSVEGENWIPFTKLSEGDKAIAVSVFSERKEKLKMAIGASSEKIMTVPSDEYILFRNIAVDPEIAIAAWAYTFPVPAAHSELNTWRNKVSLQDVRIGFSWDGRLLSNIPFMLESNQRYTDLEGWFVFDRPLPVNNSYNIDAAGNNLSFKVESGKSDYIFDITKSLHISALAKLDEIPLKDESIDVSFDNKNFTLATDSEGKADITIPLVPDLSGCILIPQPECRAMCREDVQSFIPSAEGENHVFNFSFTSVKPTEPPKPELEPETELEPDPEPETKPQFVTFTILDYEGFPVTDMPVDIVLKNKEVKSYTTDSEGKISVPRECFKNRDKIKVKFNATTEYQENHDLHYVKNKKKNEAKI